VSESSNLKTHIAVVVPVFNSLKTLSELIERLEAALTNLTPDYQIVLVDDRGPQPVWPVIKSHSERDSRIVGLRLSRNFGQHAAITAGIRSSNADWYVVMDCDLQDRPEDIITLYKAAKEGKHDSVLAVRAQEEISRSKKLGSILFNFALNKLADIPVTSDVGNFRIFNQKMAGAYDLYREQMRLFPALMSHLGFNVGQVEVTRSARPEGKSSYSLAKLFGLGFDSIISNTIKPVYFMATFGCIVAVMAFIYTVTLVIRKTVYGIDAEGWASTMAAILMMGGIQIFAISFVGIYVGKVFFQVKQRPDYILEDVTFK